MFDLKPLKWICCASAFIAALMFAAVPGYAKPAPAASPLDRISWIIGKWDAVNSPEQGVPISTKLDAQWNGDHTAIEVTAARQPAGQKDTPSYSGTYSWDAKTKKIVVKLAYANGDIFDGTVFSDGSDFDEVGQLVRADGSKQNVQMTFASWVTSTFDLTIKAPAQSATALPLVFLREDPFTNAAAGAAEITPPVKTVAASK
jgi:hypothetical protein